MRKLILSAAILVAACSTVPAQPPVVGGGGAACRNDGLDRFVGQPASSEVGAQMLAASGARVVRWVAMGMLITMEYRADRLTVRLDANNRILSATCG